MVDQYGALNGFIKQAYMNYKEKLSSFNDTRKYELESFFFRKLIDAKLNEKVLDYGCGLGRMVWQLRMQEIDAYGFDVVNYRENDNPVIFRNEYHFAFDKIYFMHSFAHLPKPEALFETYFKDLLKTGGRVYIFTPNRDWLDYMKDESYIPDTTVVRHYNLAELKNLFGRFGYVVEQEGQYGPSNVARVCERIFLVARKK